MTSKEYFTKKIVFLIVCLILNLYSYETFAQIKKQSKFGFQFSYGKPYYIPSFADGAPSYKGRNFFDVGFLYFKPFSDKWEFETGLIYSNNQFRVTPSFPPGASNYSYGLAMNHWIIPANFRLKFSNQFFLLAGANLSQANRESFGLLRFGFSLGFGREFRIEEKYTLLIAPTFNANPFFPANSEGITQLGIRSIFAFPRMLQK